MADEQQAPKGVKQKLKILSVSGIEASKKKRVVIVVSAVIAVLVFAVMLLVKNDPKPVRKKVDVSFVDTTPTPTSQADLAISALQKQLAEMNAKLDAAKKVSDAGQKTAAEQIEASDKRAKDEAERLAKQISDLQDQLKKQKAMAGATGPSQSADAAGNPYLMPNLPGQGTKSPIELPGGAKDMGFVPPQAPAVKQQVPWTQLPEPTVLTGTDATPSNVLSGASSAADDAPAEKDAGSFLPMGAWTNVVLMTGADFGAGRSTRSNPQPVLMRLMDDAILPNDARYQLQNCSAMGSGYGEMSSERVYISVTRISCVDALQGRVLESPVVGYIADSDGKLGMRGKLVSREGAVLAKAMAAGFAQGASELLSQQASNLSSTVTGSGVVTTMDPDDLGKAGGYKGASSAMDMLAKHYLDQANAIFPVIEVDSGRRATIVIQNGQQLKWREAGKEDKEK